MQSSRFKSAIIGTLILLLTPWMAGCSAIRLGYANGPQLAWWWLDGYVDFSSEQTPAAKQAIDRWFDWHRNTQLTDYAALLASTQALPLTLIGEALFLGVGAPAAKSVEFVSVSVHPFAPRRTALVLLGAGVGPAPSKQLAVAPKPT